MAIGKWLAYLSSQFTVQIPVAIEKHYLQSCQIALHYLLVISSCVCVPILSHKNCHTFSFSLAQYIKNSEPREIHKRIYHVMCGNISCITSIYTWPNSFLSNLSHIVISQFTSQQSTNAYITHGISEMCEGEYPHLQSCTLLTLFKMYEVSDGIYQVGKWQHEFSQLTISESRHRFT